MSDPAPPNPQNRTSLSVNTGGGPFVAGNVHTGGGNFVTGDQIAVTINNIVQGINDLPTRYDGVVRNFLEYYLGSTAQPAPFGGRDDALAMLDHWLADPQAPPYALLAAPAGRGKSALLAHWVSQLAQRNDVHVIYFPISIRFNSNRDSVVFAALAARIAHVYGEKMTRANDAQEYRGVFVDYLRRTPPDGKRLLVVLDGLDEAAGWEAGADLFPIVSPNHLRVIVAARLLADDMDGKGWLAQLGWERASRSRVLPLAGLDRKGVADVLEKMGNPLDHLIPQMDIVTQLYKLSEGDPLLIRLYVEALLPYGNQAATLRPIDLLTLQPGLKAYFDQWFKGQEALWKSAGAIFDRRCVNILLDLCAIALGPLSKEDILALALDRFENSHNLQLSVTALNRFLIGDGSVTSGYIFSHPRLRDYFYERLIPSERGQWQDRFLRCGQETLIALEDKKLDPSEASSYFVRYYSLHLNIANAQADNYYALICEGWLRAWEWVENEAPNGFLSDVYEAWKHAEKEGSFALGQMIRSALCFSSVTSIGTNISTELLIASVKAGLVSPQLALIMARLKPDAEERARCLIAISYLLSADLKQITLNEALTSVYSITHKRERFDVLVSMARRMPIDKQLTVLEEALTIARSIENEETRCNALLVIVDLLPLDQKAIVATEALTAARTITDARSRTWALQTIAGNLTDEQQSALLAEMLNSARMINDKKNCFNILSALSQCLPSEQYLSMLLEEMLEVAYSIEDETRRAEALCILSTYPSSNLNKLWTKMLDAARTIRNEAGRASTLCILYSKLSDATQLWIELLDTTVAIKNNQSRFQALRTLVKHIPLDKQQLVLAEALDTARAIKDEAERIHALTDLVEFLSADEQTLVLMEVLAIARTSCSEAGRFRVLRTIAVQLPPHQQDVILAETLSLARMIDDPYQRARTLIILAKPLSPSQQLTLSNEALTVAYNISYERNRSEVIFHLIDSLQPTVNNLWYKAVEIARTVNDEGIRSSILFSIASRLLFDQQPAVLAEALTLARTIGDEEEQSNLLTVVTQHLPTNEQQPILNEALAAARFISEKENRVTILINLANYLPLDQKLLVLSEVLEAVRSGNAEVSDTDLLSNIAKLLPVEATHLWSELLTIINSIDNKSNRSKALISIVEYLPLEASHLWSELLVVVSSINDKQNRAKTLISVAEYLPSAKQTAILAEALYYARGIDDSEERVETLISIAWSLPSTQRSSILIEIIATALRIDNKASRSRALKIVAGYDHTDIDLPTSDELQAPDRDIGDETDHGWALRTVAEYLPDDAIELWVELLMLVRSINNQWNRSETLRTMAQYLPCDATDLWTELLSLIRAIDDKKSTPGFCILQPSVLCRLS